MVIEWSIRAHREFASPVAYIEKRSPNGASRVARRILKRVEDLSVFAEQGVPVGRDTRRLDVGQTPYLVFYRIKADRVIVIGIVHGRRKRRS